MSVPKPHSVRHVAGTYNLIENVIRRSLKGGPLLEALQLITQVIRTEREKQPSFVLLPAWVCQAAGGDLQPGLVVSGAWCLLHTAASLLDDVEDGEFAGKPWPPMSAAEAINAATALIFASQLVLEQLERLGKDAGLALALWQTFSQASMHISAGQHLSLVADHLTLEEYWQMVAAKSGRPFDLACRAGAMLATTNSSVIEQYGTFGHNLGLLIQIADDFNGVWNPLGSGDLVTRSKTLPVLYALDMSSAEERRHLLALLDRAPEDTEALIELRDAIAGSGTLEYLVVQAELYRCQAREALPSPEGDRSAHRQLLDLLDKVMPVSSSAS
jgi:geranylgeranyl pyrophosphate synthase